MGEMGRIVIGILNQMIVREGSTRKTALTLSPMSEPISLLSRQFATQMKFFSASGFSFTPSLALEDVTLEGLIRLFSPMFDVLLCDSG